jgi:hypothetical protein
MMPKGAPVGDGRDNDVLFIKASLDERYAFVSRPSVPRISKVATLCVVLALAIEVWACSGRPRTETVTSAPLGVRPRYFVTEVPTATAQPTPSQ